MQGCNSSNLCDFCGETISWVTISTWNTCQATWFLIQTEERLQEYRTPIHSKPFLYPPPPRHPGADALEPVQTGGRSYIWLSYQACEEITAPCPLLRLQQFNIREFFKIWIKGALGSWKRRVREDWLYISQHGCSGWFQGICSVWLGWYSGSTLQVTLHSLVNLQLEKHLPLF